MSVSTQTMVALEHALGSRGIVEEIVSILNSGGLLPGSPPFGSAFTLTYATQGNTIAAVTTHAITDSSGGTASTSALAAQSVATTATDGTTPSAACTKTSVDTALGVIRNNISTLGAEMALLEADLLATKKNLNAVIAALQTGGILQ